MGKSLWFDDIEIKETPKAAKKVIEKVKKPVTAKVIVEKAVKSKTITLQEKLKLIKQKVLEILGVYKDRTILIKSRNSLHDRSSLHDYIDEAIANGIIAIDTETNNSLDPISCKLLGVCIYTPGQKNAYIPINHVDQNTRERLDWQLTEEDIKEEFSRLVNTKIIMHNGKFDYKVIKKTCNVELKVYWDTMIGARLLDENERSAGLKQQYIEKIDPTITKYDIEYLFENVEYAVVDPELFALYAATDSYMTYKLYEWQKKRFDLPENEKLLKILLDREMPILIVAAEMELTGVCIDEAYAKRLSDKYHRKIEKIDRDIEVELNKLKPQIDAWRMTPDANFKAKKLDKNGAEKEAKSKSEQLADPPSVGSPTQLAILLYDILKVGIIDKKNSRGTGEEILNKISLPICNLILQKRGVEKLLGTYIDKLPACVSPVDHRLHANFQQIDTATGRFASNSPNLQNIPSHEKSIRKMFVAGYTDPKYVECIDSNKYELCKTDQVKTSTGWKECNSLQVGDHLVDDDENTLIIKSITFDTNKCFILV